MILRTLVLVVALTAALTGLARAQTAPEGNAHPQSHIISNPGEALDNPFGPVTLDRADPQAKWAFAQAVDLAPLRDVAVFHNGRVKILDSLGRETVLELTGKKTYRDYLRVGGEGGAETIKEVKYNPLFTCLDLMIDPMYYTDKRLIVVSYLPLREAILQQAFPDDATLRERWKRVTRISPQIFQHTFQAVAGRQIAAEQYLQGLRAVQDKMALWEQSIANLVVVAPPAKDKPWAHLAQLNAGSPARDAAEELGRAWRAMDAPGANAAIAKLAEILPTINASVYPTSKRTLELTYNRANAFEWGYWMYFLALVSLMLAFGTGRRSLVVIGVTALVAAVGLHTFGFSARCLIAERFAIQNQYESMTGLSLFATVVGLGIMVLKRQWLFGAAAAGVGFLVLITATQTGIPGVHIEKEAAILNTSVLLKYHVTTVLVSYGLIALGFIVSLFYLGTHYAARLRGAAPALAGAGGENLAAGALGLDDDAPRGTQRTLKDLDTAQMTVLQLAFWTLGVGILLGAWWADHSWGRWWAFDPKETWALATWIIYLIVIHVRFASGRNRALTTAWLSVLGFIVMLWTYFGVNLLLPGLHAYA